MVRRHKTDTGRNNFRTVLKVFRSLLERGHSENIMPEENMQGNSKKTLRIEHKHVANNKNY